LERRELRIQMLKENSQACTCDFATSHLKVTWHD